MQKLTLYNIKAFTNSNEPIALKVKGDCMEAVDISEGDIIVIDLTKKPIPKTDKRDIVLIWDLENNNPAVKEYIGAWGNLQWVSTRYANVGEQSDGSFRMNQAFITSRILGVIYACYSPDMELKWQRDISDNPNELSYKQMIKSNHMGKPILTVMTSKQWGFGEC